MLLSNQGVPDEVFIKLQNDMLDKLSGERMRSRDSNQKTSDPDRMITSSCFDSLHGNMVKGCLLSLRTF